MSAWWLVPAVAVLVLVLNVSMLVTWGAANPTTSRHPLSVVGNHLPFLRPWLVVRRMLSGLEMIDHRCWTKRGALTLAWRLNHRTFAADVDRWYVHLIGYGPVPDPLESR